MDLSDYIQTGETVHCQMGAEQGSTFDESSTISVACTDSRLIFADGKQLTDIDLSSICEMRVQKPTYWNDYTQLALLGLVGALLAYILIPQMPEIAELMPAAVLIIGIFATVSLLYGLDQAKWTLEVVTTNSKYTLRNKEEKIVKIAHAVRGSQ